MGLERLQHRNRSAIKSAKAMAQLGIRVLGTPEIEHGGRLLQLPTRKALALLIYLAMEDGVQRREALMVLLWPESDDEQGRASLRNTLAYINKALRDADTVPHLDVTRETIALLDDQNLWVDALALGTMARRQDVLACYRGEFLEGFSLSDSPEFDDWASAQHKRLHDQITEVIHQAASRASGWTSGEASHEAGDAISQRQLFEGVGQWFQTAAEAQTSPLVLLLDDIQVLDGTPRDLLQFVLRSWTSRPTRILPLLIWRLEEDYAGTETSAWISSLNRETALQCVSLRALSQQETVQLVRRLEPITRFPMGNSHSRNKNSLIIGCL
jgi:hypothetical protein